MRLYIFIATAVLAGSLHPALAQKPDPADAAPPPPPISGQKIVAVVNGDVITTGDVDNRGRLFALTTGLPVTQDVLNRLRAQVTKQLIDERLRLQEVQRRKISVSDREIADSIAEIEQRNTMPKGALTASLQGKGVAIRTLIDQVRVQLGWTRVLRQELGGRAEVTDADVAEQTKRFQDSVGKPEFRVGQIFIPVEDPSKQADARRFADTVIGQLRAGAPFAVVAAQFSQAQNALQGGDLGWVRASQLDPPVADVVRQMPENAVSNPISVPGGIAIVTLRGKRQIGNDSATVLNLRQAFLPFTGALNPKAPNEQQRRAVEQATAISKSAKSCADMEAANTRAGSPRPANPGEVRLDGVGSPPLRALLTGLQPGIPSKPVITSDGVAVLMVCSKEQKSAAAPTKEEIGNLVLNERIESTSRQLQRDLRRRATLDERSIS